MNSKIINISAVTIPTWLEYKLPAGIEPHIKRVRVHAWALVQDFDDEETHFIQPLVSDQYGGLSFPDEMGWDRLQLVGLVTPRDPLDTSRYVIDTRVPS